MLMERCLRCTCVCRALRRQAHAGETGGLPRSRVWKSSQRAGSEGRCAGLSAQEAPEAETGPCASLLDYDRDGGWQPAALCRFRSFWIGSWCQSHANLKQ